MGIPMNFVRLAFAMAFVVLMAGCAQAPVAPVASSPLPLPMVTSSGLVIGTMSYHYVETGPDESAWVVHLRRVDAPEQDYALVVAVDPATRSGIFTGALPAGVYAFQEAANAGGRYRPGTLKMPFEVQAGSVRDAGHYALNPLGKL